MAENVIGVWCIWMAACLCDLILSQCISNVRFLLWYTKNRCAPIYTRHCFSHTGPMKTGTVLEWIHLSLNVCVCVSMCAHVHKDQILWRKRAREGKSEGGLWPQCFFASVFNFRGLLSDFQCLDIAHLTFPPLCLEYFHIHTSQLSKQLSAIVFDLPMGSTVFSTCYAGHHLCLCHLSLPQIGQAPKMHEDLCPLTLTAFSKTRASRGRSPLGPSI